MSAQEARNEIIRENLPQLIKALTGFKDDDENLRHCEQFAWSIIRNHRNLSTNSHEVRRKIEGIQEKFTVENCGEYAQHLGQLCDEIVHHPLCLEHYEVDVQWSLLDLLLELAYNPAGSLRRKKHTIQLLPCEAKAATDEGEAQSEADYWQDVLKEDFIPVKRYSDSDSDLSNWSDESELPHTPSGSKEDLTRDEPARIPATPTAAKWANIKPPEKAQPYIVFNNSDATQRLLNNVQHTWWLEDPKEHRPTVESTRIEANFALVYNQFLGESSNHLIRPKAPVTATEHCLMRELLWMFHAPQTCKFFKVSDNVIGIRENVSVPSLTVSGLANSLEQHFLPYIRMMQTLRKFLDSIYVCEDFTPPKTLECYAASLRLLLAPIWQQLLDYEQRLVVQRDREINTIISMRETLLGTFAQLSRLYDVHCQVVLNLRQHPAHISSAFLLASLMQCHRLASNATEANLAMALFLSSVKIYCAIVDTWWTEGRLDDWQQEFLVERVSNTDQTVCVRQYAKNKEKSFFVATNVSKIITENSFFRLLLEHSLEAGCTLNLLYEINRIGDLRNACAAIEGKLYNVFIEDVLKSVRTLQSQSTLITLKEAPVRNVESTATELTVKAAETPTCSQQELTSAKEISALHRNLSSRDTVDTVDRTLNEASSNSSQTLLNNLTTSDEFLLMAFTSNMELSQDTSDAVIAAVSPAAEREPDALSIFTQFQQSGRMLPLEEVILSALTRILRTRIAFANSFVMRLYRDEFVILKHLGNIRKVLLLEASDVMHQFYDKLFKQIESGSAWTNPFLLTMQLDDIICAKFPEMSSLFRVEINSTFRCQTQKVFEAVDELIVTYNFSRELAHIITQDDIEDYNKVFRFLLKVKWGITTLENLQFPRTRKRAVPYAPFELVDLLMRRLEQLRFWMIYALQSIHFHLMTHVLQSMGEQLDEKIANCTNLKEMERVHKSYVSTVCEHCFLLENLSAIKLGVEQLLNLTFILRLEWNSCVKHIESNHPLALDLNDSGDETDYVTNSQIDAIELTYIRCHQYLANKLNNEVYLQQNTFLLGLSAAFNTSLPY